MQPLFSATEHWVQRLSSGHSPWWHLPRLAFQSLLRAPRLAMAERRATPDSGEHLQQDCQVETEAWTQLALNHRCHPHFLSSRHRWWQGDDLPCEIEIWTRVAVDASDQIVIETHSTCLDGQYESCHWSDFGISASSHFFPKPRLVFSLSSWTASQLALPPVMVVGQCQGARTPLVGEKLTGWGCHCSRKMLSGGFKFFLIVIVQLSKISFIF